MAGRGRTAVAPARRVVQGAFALLSVAVGLDLSKWAAARFAGADAGVARPPGGEGFLPIRR